MSEYATFERTMDSARIQLNGALDGVLKLELYWVLKEFFDRSLVWRERIITPVCRSGSECSAEIIPENYPAQIISLIEARAVTCAKAHNVPLAATLELPNRVFIHDLTTSAQEPQSSIKVAFSVVLSVADPTLEDGIPYCPAWVETRHGDTIMHGLLYRMMAQAQKPYSNLAGAQFHGQKFRSGIAYAKNEDQHGNVRGGQTWTFPQTFRTRRRGF